MKKLTHFATTLANNTLTVRDMTFVKGGTDNQQGNNNSQGTNQNSPTTNITQIMEDEKRRERPGGGITTN